MQQRIFIYILHKNSFYTQLRINTSFINSNRGVRHGEIIAVKLRIIRYIYIHVSYLIIIIIRCRLVVVNMAV